jgi:hypothetical protein
MIDMSDLDPDYFPSKETEDDIIAEAKMESEEWMENIRRKYGRK